MTNDEINLRIAQAIGWRADEVQLSRVTMTKRPGIQFPWVNERTGEKSLQLPDFVNDLNAMHEAEKVLMETDPQAWNRYVEYLFNRCADGTTNDPDFGALLNTSAALRSRDFLRAIRRWE